MRERALLAVAVALVAAGALAAALYDDAKGPASCVRGIVDRLGYDLQLDVVVQETGEQWTSNNPVDGRLVLRVSGTGGTVTDVQVLAGQGADLLERPARLEALAVEC